MKKLFPLAFLIVALFVVLLFQNNTTKNLTKGEKPVFDASLRLKWINQAQFAGFYVANSKDLYDKEGIKINIHPGGPEISPLQMVITGVDQFGITGADQLIIARSKGIPVVALAVIYKKSPVAIASLKKNNILKPQDLEGKTVGVVYGRDEETIYKALLNKEGIDRNKIKEVPKVFDSSQISSEAVDAAIVYETDEPVILRQKGFDVNVLRPYDYGINFYSDTLFTTEDMIKKHPDEVKRFVKASIDGWKFALQDQDFAVDEILKMNNQLDKNHQAEFLRLSASMIDDGEIGIPDNKVLGDMEELLIGQGVIENRIELNKLFFVNVPN